MTCLYPTTGWQIEKGEKLVFKEPKNWINKYQVPCRTCPGCILDRANEWATRSWVEAKQWPKNTFITLTYDPKHLPENSTLVKKDLKNFWKRLRNEVKGIKPIEKKCRKKIITKYKIIAKINNKTGKKYNRKKAIEWEYKTYNKIVYPIRYLATGEYGEKKGRPHYHAAIYNYEPTDLKFYKYNKVKDKLYKSKQMTRIWGKGNVIIGNITYESACYIARYCTKKLYGKNAKWYAENNKLPEFIEPSRDGGIGKWGWDENAEKYKQNGGIYIKTKKGVQLKKLPKFYKNKWKKENEEEFEEWQFIQSEKYMKTINEILKNTSMKMWEYEEMKKNTLLEKFSLLKRNNFNI